MPDSVERPEEAAGIRLDEEVSGAASGGVSDLPDKAGKDAADAGWLSVATADPAFFIKEEGLE